MGGGGWGGVGWGVGGGIKSHSPKCDETGRARTLAFGFLVCSLENLFIQLNEIISTSKLPFHNPLVIKYYNVISIFFYRLRKLSFYYIQLVDYFALILYLSNTHKLHGL